MVKHRIYLFRGREVVLMEDRGQCCWRVRFVEYARVQHTALIDPREVIATPFVFTTYNNWPLGAVGQTICAR